MARRLIVAPLLVVLACAGTSARAAAGEPSIEVAAAVADDIDAAALARSLRIELGAEAAEVAVAVEPAPDGVLVVVRMRGEERRETVVLSDAPKNARVRVLALAIGEIVRRPAQAPPASAPIAPPIAPTAPPASEVPRPPPPPRPFALSLEGGARITADRSRTFPFARLVGHAVVARAWALHVSFDGARDAADDALGRAALTVLAIGAGSSLRATSSALSFELGPRVLAGWASGTGTAGASATSRAIDSLVVLGGVGARLRFPDASRLFGTVDAEIDYALRGLELRADDRVLLGLTGVVLSIGAGVGIRL